MFYFCQVFTFISNFYYNIKYNKKGENMKFKRIMLVGIFLLAILTIGSVCAEDNATDDAIPTDNDDNSAEVIPHSLEGDDWPSEIDMNLRYGEDTILKDEPIYFIKTITDGKIDVSIDGKQKTAVYDGSDEVDEVFRVPTNGLALGEHILNVKVTKATEFKDADRNFTFYISDIVVDVPNPIIDDGISYNDMNVRVNSADAGKLVVAIDDKTYTYTKVSSFSKVYSLNDLSAFGNPHIIKVTYTTAKGVIYNETFIVNTTYFYLWDRDVKYDNDKSYSFLVPDKFDPDKMNVKIDNEPCNFTKSWSIYYSADISNIGLGNHTIVVSYDGDDKFAPCYSSAKIRVYPYLTFSDDYITVDEKITIDSKMPVSDCNMSVYVDGKLYDSKSFAKAYYETYYWASMDITGLKVGGHKVRVEITGDYSYTYTGRIYVYVDIKGPSSVNVGETGNFTVNFPNAKGELIADFGSVNVTGQFINGTANIRIPETLKVGIFDVYFIYNDENNPFNVSEVLFVEPIFHVPESVTNGNGYVYMTLPYDEPNAEFIVEAYNKQDKYVLSAKFKDRKASIPLNGINAGDYEVFPKYFDGVNWSYHGTVAMKVKNTKLAANDLTKYYGSATGFKVKVTDYNGKVVKSKYVYFYINGKYVKKVKTNKYGYATLKIGKAPGSYKISAKYGKVQITRKLTVKHAVTLKTVTVKKSAKSITLKATLKKGKTPIKYKYVKFYFNGKFIKKVKTSKYGIAKVTIKKTVLKKLKVGKTVKYQATYLKDTVKKSAVVKK